LKRRIDQIVIHCTATPNGRACFSSTINGWHRDRGFKRSKTWRKRLNFQFDAIGYHGIIHHSGVYQSGRHFDEVGAHARGNNTHSIGLAMVGTDQFNRDQWLGLRSAVTNVIQAALDGVTDKYPDLANSVYDTVQAAADYNIEVTGHRDLSPDVDGDGEIEPFEWLKTCPGFDAAEWFYTGMRFDFD